MRRKLGILILVGVTVLAGTQEAVRQFEGLRSSLTDLTRASLWSGLIVYERVVASLPPATIWLLAVGGVLYSAGVIFHLWESLRFQNAIWHGFVLAAAACHYGAVLDCLVLTRLQT